MLFRALIVATFVAAANGQAVAPPGGCLVCGDGSVVTSPDAIFSFPGQPEVPCGTLQMAGLQGSIPLDQCGFLVALVGACNCAPGDLPAAPTPVPASTPAPVSAPTPAPVPVSTPVPMTPAPMSAEGVPLPCPVVPDGGCSVCGEGMCVTLPESIFVFPGQPEVPCADLESAGFGGQVPLDQCPFLPSLAASTCGCASELPVPAPTDAPVTAPTDAPVTAPTDAPVTAPTDAPVPAPTVAPVPAPIAAPVGAPVKNPIGKDKMGKGGSKKSKDKDKKGKMGKTSKRRLSAPSNTKAALPRGY